MILKSISIKKTFFIPAINQDPPKPFKLSSPDKSKKTKKDLEKEKQQKKKTKPYDLMSGQ